MVKRVLVVVDDVVVNTIIVEDSHELLVGEYVHPEGVGRGFILEADGSFTSNLPPAVPEVPSRLTKLQLVRALRKGGYWGNVKAALAQSDTVTREDWEYASVINRDDILVESFAAMLEITPAKMDLIFIEGITL